MKQIPPPELPKLIVNSSGKHKYVFTYKNRWDSEKQRAWRGKGDSKCVGKLLPVEGKPECGEILFNDEFKEKYSELEDLRVFRYKGGRLEFKPLDDDTHSVHHARTEQRLHAGATWVLNQIVGASPLGMALKETFADYKVALRLLSLAYYHVVCKDRAMCNYEEFAECTWLPYARGCSGSSVGRLLKGITKHKVSKFLTKLNEAYVREQGQSLCERRFWALDSTSISSYSANIDSVEYGHNKDEVCVPQTNVLLIVDQQSGTPVYFRNFDGNVPDTCTIRNTLAELAMLKIDTSNVVLVTDKGYCSSGNWEDLMRNGVSFISNARRNLNAAITQIIEEHYAELIDWNHSIGFINQNAVTVPLQWRYDEFPIKGKKKQKNAVKTLYVHLYYSKAINDEMADRLKLQLRAAIEQHRLDEGKLSEAQKKLLKDYTQEADGKPVINMSRIDKKLRYAGVRVLVSDAIADPLECSVAYEERNEVEYAFNTLKSRLSCNRTGVHSTRAWDGRLFLEVLATAINSMERARVRLYNETAVKNKYRVHYDSDGKLLAKLNNVYMTKFSDGWIFDEVVGKKKELFKILNVPVPSAEQSYERVEPTAEADETPSDIEDLAIETAEDPLEDL